MCRELRILNSRFLKPIFYFDRVVLSQTPNVSSETGFFFYGNIISFIVVWTIFNWNTYFFLFRVHLPKLFAFYLHSGFFFLHILLRVQVQLCGFGSLIANPFDANLHLRIELGFCSCNLLGRRMWQLELNLDVGMMEMGLKQLHFELQWRRIITMIMYSI